MHFEVLSEHTVWIFVVKEIDLKLGSCNAHFKWKVGELTTARAHRSRVALAGHLRAAHREALCDVFAEELKIAREYNEQI
ncbi:hypothetical protein CYMTET_11475, partial [Cymbomonas tetramitiformis]